MKPDYYQQQQHLSDWISQSSVDVFATLKFKNGYDISDQQADRTLRIFLNKADRTYFGKSLTKNGVKLNRYVFLHKGRSGTNTHYHVVFKSFGGISTFCQTVKNLWLSHCEACPTSQITVIKDRRAVSNYCLHEFHLLKDKTFIPEYSNSDEPDAQDSSINKRMYVARLVKANYPIVLEED